MLKGSRFTGAPLEPFASGPSKTLGFLASGGQKLEREPQYRGRLRKSFDYTREVKHFSNVCSARFSLFDVRPYDEG